jgi:hypothetical protein
LIFKLNIYTELEPVNEQPNHYLVHLDGSGKANSFPHQPFDPSVEGQMFPLQLLRSPLAYHMLVWIQMSVIGTSAISVEATNAQRCEQRFQC